MYPSRLFASAAEVTKWAKLNFPDDFAALHALENLDFEVHERALQLKNDTPVTALAVTSFEPLDDRPDVPFRGTGVMRLLVNMEGDRLVGYVVRNDSVVFVSPFLQWVKTYGPTYLTEFEGDFATTGQYPSRMEVALEVEAVARYRLALKGVSDALRRDETFGGNFRRACRRHRERLEQDAANDKTPVADNYIAPPLSSKQGSVATTPKQAYFPTTSHTLQQHHHTKAAKSTALQPKNDLSDSATIEEDFQKMNLSKSLDDMHHLSKDHAAKAEGPCHLQTSSDQVNDATQDIPSSQGVSINVDTLSSAINAALELETEKFEARIAERERVETELKKEVTRLSHLFKELSISLRAIKHQNDDLKGKYYTSKEELRISKAKCRSSEQARVALANEHNTTKQKLIKVEQDVVTLQKHVRQLMKDTSASKFMASEAEKRTNTHLDFLKEKFDEHEEILIRLETKEKYEEFERRQSRNL